MTEQPKEPQREENTCAAEILSIPQDEGEPCTYCAEEHPQPKDEPKPRKSRRRRTPRQPTDVPPKKKRNWFSELSFPWKIVTTVCALLASLGLGKCCANLPQPPSPGSSSCSQQIEKPAEGAVIVSQADPSGCFRGRTTYQYQTVDGIKQLISAKHYSNDGKLTAALTFTRNTDGKSCLIQLAIYDNEGKVSKLYSGAQLPDSTVLDGQFDLWTQFGQLN